MSIGLRTAKLTALPALVALLALPPAFANADSKVGGRESVLVLHSYSPDFVWTRSQQDGIDAVFGPRANEYDLRIEYLDAVHHPEMLGGALILDFLRTKLVDLKPRIVLTSDNAAFNFARKHRAELFPDAPIVFMGVNGYEDSMLGSQKGITGVAEDSDLAGTLRLLLQLLPQTKRIVFPGMTDDITYRAIRATVARDLSALPHGVATEFPEYPDVDAALDALRHLPPDTAIVVMTNMRTRSGKGVSSQRVVELVSAAAPVPVFTNWDFVVGHGAVGGSVISGIEQGREAAEIALQVVGGERPESIPVRRGTGKTPLFDHRQLVRFGIPSSRLPPDAVVLFAPERTLRIPREVAWTAGVSLVLLSGIAASLVVSVRRRRRAEDEVRALNQELAEHVRAREETIQTRTAELRQQARYLRTLIDMLPMWAWFKDTQSRYLVTNHAHADAYGRSPEAMVGKTDFDVMAPALARSQHADDAEVMASHQRKTVEEPIADGSGSRWMETYRAAVLDEDGTLLGTVGVSRDISERKAVEAARNAALAEAQHLARLRSEFIAQISHELRTPLHGILGYAQVLQRNELLDDRQRAGLSIIQRSGEQLLALINDVLDFARIEAGKVEVIPGDIDLRRLVRSIADTVKVRAEEKGLMLACDVDDRVAVAVRTDERLLRQVLLNLLTNAVKFTDRGQVVLRVTTPAPGRLRFAVEDSGIGIAPDGIEAIFQPFEQVGEARRRTEGTGLGLAISRHFVERMGGAIHVTSAPGKGSTFWFEIDAVSAFSCELPASITGVIVGYEGARKTILAVDDLADCNQLIRHALEPLGFEVATAGCGIEALDAARYRCPDLVLMDDVMPDMNGQEVVRQLRTMPGLEYTPVIFISAGVPTDWPKDVARENGFLSKPVKLDALFDLLAQMLGLEWVVQPSRDQSTEDREPANVLSEIVPPPREEMKILHDLALQGDMREIRRRTTSMLAGNPRHHAFARQLQQLAESYRSRAILSLVEQHLNLAEKP